MSGKLQLLLGGEDAQACQRAVVPGFLHEDRFGKIHLARDGEHDMAGKAVAVRDDREWIAFKACSREDVECVETMFHLWCISQQRLAGSNAFELGDSPFAGYIASVQCSFRFDQQDMH